MGSHLSAAWAVSTGGGVWYRWAGMLSLGHRGLCPSPQWATQCWPVAPSPLSAALVPLLHPETCPLPLTPDRKGNVGGQPPPGRGPAMLVRTADMGGAARKPLRGPLSPMKGWEPGQAVWVQQGPVPAPVLRAGVDWGRRRAPGARGGGCRESVHRVLGWARGSGFTVEV